MSTPRQARLSQYSEEEFGEFLKEFEQVTERKPWLTEKGIITEKSGTSAFYLKRRNYYERHPEAAPDGWVLMNTDALSKIPVKKQSFKKTLIKRPSKPAEAPPEQSGFNALSRETKLRLAAEYARLSRNEKQTWRNDHAVDRRQIAYWITTGNRLKHAAPASASPNGGFDMEGVRQALVNEYLQLTGNGDKAVWLKRYGIGHQNMFDIKRGGGKKVIPRIVSLRPDLQQRFGSTQVLAPIPAPSYPAFYPAPLTQTATQGPPENHGPSLDDAIAAFEVKRDELNSFIAQLKQFRSAR